MDEHSYRVRVAVHGPKIKTELLVPGSPEALSIIATRFSLIEHRNLGFATFAQFVNFCNLVSIDDKAPDVIGVLRPNNVGGFELAINFKVWLRLSLPVRRELLKALLMRIPLGHFSGRMQRLKARYGPKITQLAADIVIAQSINSAILAEEGIYVSVPEFFEFERNLTTDEYCQLLDEGGDGDGDSGSTPELTPEAVQKMVQHMFDLTDAQLPNVDMEGTTQPNGLTRISSLEHSESDCTTVELDNISDEFIQKIESAMQSLGESLKTQGHLPGEASQFIASLQRPSRVPWTRYLRNAFANAQSRLREMNPKRPSRRPAFFTGADAYQYYRGDLVRKPTTRVLLIIDTSGSMSPKELRCVEAEAKFMCNKQALVYVTHVDAGVAKPPELFNKFQSIETFFGRGGTSFIPGFEAAKAMRPAPDLIVYFTDGCGTAPSEQEFNTLWLLTSSGMSVEHFQKNICAWGSVAVVDVEDS